MAAQHRGLQATIVAGLSLLLPAVAPAQAVIGRAVDVATDQPVRAVEVAVLGFGEVPAGLAVTDSTGWFRIPLAEPGLFRLRAVAPGYDSLTAADLDASEGEEVVVELRLGPRPLELEPIAVMARRNAIPLHLRDFYFRAERYEKTGRGFVLDRAALAENHGLTARAVLRRYTGMVEDIVGGGPSRLVLKRRYVDFFRGHWCDPAFFLDGLPVDGQTIRSIPASDLEGLEVYRGLSQVPAAYLRSGAATTCGVILAWTRRPGPAI